MLLYQFAKIVILNCSVRASAFLGNKPVTDAGIEPMPSEHWTRPSTKPSSLPSGGFSAPG